MLVQEIKKFGDLIGLSNIFQYAIHAGFTHVSFRGRSVPSEGSPCFELKKISNVKDKPVIRTTMHKNGSFTVFTNTGNYRFWKI